MKTILPSSLTIRIAREYRGCGTILKMSTLICGPPGCGKTTLLRDCVRLLSDKEHQRVSLVDERGEVAALQNGLPQLYVGSMTDVMSNCTKSAAIPMLLRTMTPQWIAVDEITTESDAEAVCRSAYCGVHILATCHIWEKEDLQRRPVYRRLLRANIFPQMLLLRQDHTWRMERLDSG